MTPDRPHPSSAPTDAGAIPNRLSISHAIETTSPHDFLAEIRRRSDELHERRIAEGGEEEPGWLRE